jgi:hypothetical protein
MIQHRLKDFSNQFPIGTGLTFNRPRSPKYGNTDLDHLRRYLDFGSVGPVTRHGCSSLALVLSQGDKLPTLAATIGNRSSKVASDFPARLRR